MLRRDELVKKLGDHLEPQLTVIAERYKLYHQQQKPEKTVAEYIAALWRLASTCNFEDFLSKHSKTGSYVDCPTRR